MSFKMYSNQTHFPQEYVNEHGDCSLAEKEYLIPKILERGAQRQTRIRCYHRTLQTNQPLAIRPLTDDRQTLVHSVSS